MKYSEAKKWQPALTECFFAFSNKQFEEGKAANIPAGEKILRTSAGMYGTQKGIDTVLEEFAAHEAMIVDNCDPQDIYNYEFGNHECGYTGDDSEALEIVRSYFPDAVIKRFPAELMEDY